ncbi:hypothetical protein PoB_003756200 [Plakobranchus ocellatus]|uniref:Uncharacterized protein n=1 Tax=Plakobranchus ocellatus TaxID=259542 RepID=A0AAV4AVU1_9GAST|nr:hypothetical protein PoB_003756200 [Plakobranchus ocellatus]
MLPICVRSWWHSGKRTRTETSMDTFIAGLNPATNALALEASSPQQGDFRLLGPPSGQGTGSGTRTRNRRAPADLRAGSLATVPPTLANLPGTHISCRHRFALKTCQWVSSPIASVKRKWMGLT